MNRSNITFSDLKEIVDYIEKDDNDHLCEFFNSFKGDNILDKTHSILKCWEHNVCDTLSIRIDEKDIKLQMSYVINEIPKNIDADFSVSVTYSDVKFNIFMGIPDQFSYTQDMFPIYDIVKRLEYQTQIIDFTSHKIEERSEALDMLPPVMYNAILNAIIEKKDGLVTFSNKTLSKLKFNLYTHDIFMFLKGLFSNYSKDYFRDIIYNLSKKVDGYALFHSDLKDIEYYILKFNEESKSQENDSQNL